MKNEFLNILSVLPKVEMHLHIEGALPFAMLRELDSKKYSEPPKWWNKDFRFEDFEEFDRELLEAVVPWYNSPERYHKASLEIFEDLKDQGVKYAEVSFASGIVEFCGVNGDEISEAIFSAIPKDMKVKIFMGIHRNGRPLHMEKVFQDSLSWKCLDGVDLHGDERLPLENWTAEYWGEIQHKGGYTKAHVGELCGYDEIERVIDTLNVKQIEHGVRAIESPRLLERISRERIFLDVCPTSNVKLKVATSYEAHQLRALRNAGVLCTVNSDDPLMFGSSINDEYNRLIDDMDFSVGECFDIILDGWSVAKVDEFFRNEMVLEVEKIRKKFNV